MAFKLFPQPRALKITSARLILHDRKTIRLAQSCSEVLTDAIRRFSDASPITTDMSYGAVSAGQTLLTIDPSAGPSTADSYELKCDKNGLTLRSKSDSGIFYGLATLQQILEQAGQSIPFFTLSDEADFKHRGIMLDISRCKVPSMKTLLALIDQFSRMKINQLQLYTEHTFEFVNHALVWANSSPISARETLEIQAYCRARFIELVPNLNSFGHFERWLRYPEYHSYAECPNGFTHPLSRDEIKYGSTLKPDNQSLNLLRELYDEYLPLFDSGQFNVGGDEPWELGQGRSRAKCDRLGATNVYVDFMARIKKLLDARNKKMMFWSDIILKEPACLKRLSRDLIALNWGYEGNHPFNKECAQLATQKIPFYVCPGTSSWNSLTGRISNARRNLANAARNGIKYGAEGYLITDWGDHGHHQYLPVSYPGFLMGACQSWNASASKNLDLVEGLNRIFFRDPAKLIPNLLVELGQVADLAPSKLRNATVFNRLLFWGMEQEPKVTRPVSDAQLEKCASTMADIRARAAFISATAGNDLIKEELLNAIDMATHGINRLQYFRSGLSGGTRSRRADLSPANLRTNLAQIIGRHERLWLARNRPGGLRESAGHLYQSLGCIRP